MTPTLSRSRTKIVATIGPACRAKEQLRRMFAAGADVVRLNSAHGQPAEFDQVIADVRDLEQEFGPLGILLDLAGPKIRLGTLSADPFLCEVDKVLRFVPGEVAPADNCLTSTYPTLVDELVPGNRVVLADGQVTLQVESKSGREVQCRVVSGGIIRSRQGINLPGARLTLPSLTEADHRWLEWPGIADVDFVSLSFVRRADDVRQLRQILAIEGRKPAILAKIEKPEALDDLEAIVDAADAVMVARGDLGVEIDVADVPLAQKRIVACCNRKLRPVIVATQMLDSMQHSPRPTRAEATDVANAILDGADACMLSGETAVGEFPIESVQTMNRIMLATESIFQQRSVQVPDGHSQMHPITRAMVAAAGLVARELSACLTIVATRSGATALIKSSLRDFTPSVAVSSSPRTLRRTSLFWGVHPLAGAPLEDRRQLCQFMIDWGKRQGLLHRGDLILLVSGTQLFKDEQNQLSVHQVD